MQTFLPYADFAESARVLDISRLRKQIVEAYQILQGTSWQYHPCVRMWTGHKCHLKRYAIAMCDEYEDRDFRPMLRQRIMAIHYAEMPLPSWLGDERLHLSHRSNLVRKMPTHYRFWWPDVPDNLPYFWPV